MTYQLELVKAKNGREAVMRLPVRKHGLLSPKAFQLVRERLGDGLQYSLNLEAFSSADSLMEALKAYKKNEI